MSRRRVGEEIGAVAYEYVSIEIKSVREGGKRSVGKRERESQRRERGDEQEKFWSDCSVSAVESRGERRDKGEWRKHETFVGQ